MRCNSHKFCRSHMYTLPYLGIITLSMCLLHTNMVPVRKFQLWYIYLAYHSLYPKALQSRLYLQSILYF